MSVNGQVGILKKLIRWVADADELIQREAVNWDFLHKTDYSVSTSVGVAEYLKPATLGEWDRRTFWIDRTTDNNIQLTEVPYLTWFNTYAIGTQSNSQPNNIIIKPDSNLAIYNPPDATYALTANYWRTPLRLVANGDTSLIPEAYIRAIITRAQMFYAQDQEAWDIYKTAEAEYRDALSTLKSNQLPGWEGYRVSDGVTMTVSTDGYTGDGHGEYSGFNG